MLQGIFTLQYILNEIEPGKFDPKFEPLALVLDRSKYKNVSYKEVITEQDLFALYYHHTIGDFRKLVKEVNELDDFYFGRLMDTDFQVISYFRHELDGSQYLTLLIFDLYDDIELFEHIIQNNAARIKVVIQTLVRAKNAKQIQLIAELKEQLESELKFTKFQVERVFNLDPIQKSALIFRDKRRYKILELLRERPLSKQFLIEKLYEIDSNINVDLLLEVFFELNIIRRDWIKGKKDLVTGLVKNQGEYLFLIKDILLSRWVNEKILKKLKDSKNYLYEKYHNELTEVLSSYDPLKISFNDNQILTNLLLDPDVYDFIKLLRANFYPLDKLPKILSEWADLRSILLELKKARIITILADEEGKEWVVLLTDIKPLAIFPEFLLIKLRNSIKKNDKSLTHEIKKKAIDLLEVTYPEKIEF
ncbi:MAG: hypothetical protein ACTSR8_11525 [Promethearchaeota archaeon]